MKHRILSVDRLSRPLASALAALLAATPASAATYYWDNSPGVAGFGSALGTWSATTDPALNSPLGTGWSTSSTGAAATAIGAVTTASADSLNFGSATTALAAGAISLGTADSGSIVFGSTSNGIVLSGGTITMAAAPSITVSNANTTHFIGSVLAGAGTSLTKAGAGALALSGANTYTGRTVISGGRLLINSIKNVGGVANAAGQPLLADATIAIGSATAGGNLTYLGTGDSTDRVIDLAGTTGGAVLDHSGTGLWKFTSAFTATGNGTKTLALQGLTSATGEISGAIVNSTSPTALTKSGSVTWILSGANAYTGTTTVNGGTLTLAFGAVASDIISPTSALTLGGGTLQLVGTGNQTLNGLSTTLNTGSRIVLGAGQTLTLGALTSAGFGSSLNINTLAGGANAASSTVGTGIVVLTGQTPGDAISSGYTVSDAGGFGLATVDGSNQVVRQTTGSTLLPASGALPSIDYRVDNNAVSGAAGSSSLTLTATADARSVTVDTSAASGVLTLNPGVEFYTSMWHFGGVGSNAYQISGGDGGAGLFSFASGDTISINNHNAGPVTFASPILGSGNSGVSLYGAGTTVFSGSNLYTGRTTVNAGTLKVSGGTSVIGTLFLGAAAYQQDGGNTSVTLTGGTEMNLGLAGTGTFTLSDGTFSVETGSAAAANIGHGGDLTFNQNGGLFHFAPTGANKLVNIGVTATGSATLNLSGGTFQTAADVPAYLGGRVKSVMNISGSAMVDIPNLIFNRNLSVPHTATLNLGDGTPGGGTLKTSSITKNSPAIHNISIFNFNGGTLQAGASSATFMSGLTTASVMDGGAMIDTNGFDITIAQPLLRFPGATAGGLTKKGTGILTLSGINTYRGNTSVSEGTLTLGSAADPLNANPGNDLSTVTIAAGAILDLTYTGTDKVNKLFIGVTAMAEGVYGKSGSVPPVIGIPQITGDGTLSVVPVFAAWITRPFANGTVPLDRQGADDDFDNDGISNLIEYALAGQDPTVPNPAVGTFTSGALGFTKRPEAIGLSYAIRESTDLGLADDWTEVSGGGYVNNAGGISYTLTPGSPVRNFVRLEVTLVP